VTIATPSEVYYRACVGRWRGPIEVAITDPHALRASGMKLLDRASLWFVAGRPRALGAIVMHTTVDLAGDVVLHTTAVRWLGATLMRSAERFHLDPDGRRFTVSGDVTGHGEVDATGTQATYALTSLGVPLEMRNRRDGDAVMVEQVGSGFTVRVALERVGRSPSPARSPPFTRPP
jgi:hypothetical protein